MNTPGLTIHSQQLKGDELKHFSVKKLEDPDVPAWEKDIYEFILSWLGPSDSIVQHTSGTTGKSKELHLLKSSMTRSAENTCRFFGLGKGQTALLCLPIRYIAGKMMVVRCFIAGTNLEITEPKSMPDLCGAGPVDFCAMVPLQVSNLLENPGAFPPIRKILIGGAEITAALEQMTAKIPGEVYASYGMAETCSHVALRRLNGPGRQSDYHALPEVTLTLDERGCLVINAPFLPHQVITNDIVEFTGPGSFIWKGRYDNLINSGGIKILPEELEMHILEKTGLECAIIGLPDMKLGQRLILVAEKDKMVAKETALRSELQKLLPDRLKIKDFILIEKLPRNSALKLDRKKLAGMV